MKLPSIRTIFILSFLLTVILLGFAGYLQMSNGVRPCPLCQIQRFVIGILGLLFLLAAIHNPAYKGVKFYSYMIIVFSLAGILLAGRQVWLEFNPPLDTTGCGASLFYLLKLLPISEALKIVLMGTGDCAEVTWRLFGISIPGWTLLMFIIFFIIGISQRLRAKK